MGDISGNALLAERNSPDASPAAGERHLVMLIWLCGILLGLIPSLILFLAKRRAPGWVLDQAKESLNFEITIFILCFAALVATFLIPFGFVLLPTIPISPILNLVVSFRAASKAYRGESYRIHWVLRLVK